MKKLLIAAFSLTLALCCVFAFNTVAFADEDTSITTAEEFLNLNGKTGNYVLNADIVLPDGKYVNSFYGTLDGNNHSVTINNSVGVFNALGRKENLATVKDLTVKGTVKGTGKVAGLAANAAGNIERVTVETDVSSTANSSIGGIANCTSNKDVLNIKDCVFAGTVTLLQGFTTANNYTYWGMFTGYNGGISTGGGAKLINCIAKYTFTIPTAETAKVKEIQFFNTNYDKTESVKNSYTTEVQGDNTVYTFNGVVNMDPVTASSVSDEGIMANYGSPVIRFVLNDNSYRYLDGMDRAQASYISTFEAESFNKMYKYADISYLPIRKVNDASVSDGSTSVSSTYSEVTINTAEEFESFARIINSSIPATFTNEEGQLEGRSILDTLAISIKLGKDIDLTVGDENGNKSEFYGLGKQEFFPYRGGINGDGHTLKLNIDAPNGYCVGVIGVVSEMAEEIGVKNLTVEGSIKGKTKVGVVGYFDMVCNAYIEGGNINFDNVVNNADVTGYACVGGLLGAVSNARDAIKTYVTDCENNGDITLLENGAYAGGIIGCAGFYGSNPTGVDIDGVVNNGDVTALAGANYVGGVIGKISNDSSTVTDATNKGNVTADAGKVCGNVIGETKAVKFDGDPSDIGNYTVSSSNEITSVGFLYQQIEESYGNLFSVYTNKVVSPDYALDLIYEYNDQTYVVKSSETVTVTVNQNGTEKKYTSYRYIIDKIEPGEYTLKLKAHTAEGYCSNGTIEENVILDATSTLTIGKKALSYTFENASAPYSGKGIDYFAALERNPSYKPSTTSLPDTSSTTGAKWAVEYYKDGVKLSANPIEPGDYTVKLKIQATDTFKSRYEFSDEDYTANLKIMKLLTVTAKNYEITKGETISYGANSVTCTTYDGSAFNNASALNLKFYVGVTQNTPTAMLSPGVYTFKVEGVETYGDYYIEYKTGTITVKTAQPVDSSSSSTGGKTLKGCKNSVSATLPLFGVLAVCAAFGLKRKKH